MAGSGRRDLQLPLQIRARLCETAYSVWWSSTRALFILLGRSKLMVLSAFLELSFVNVLRRSISPLACQSNTSHIMLRGLNKLLPLIPRLQKAFHSTMSESQRSSCLCGPERTLSCLLCTKERDQIARMSWPFLTCRGLI